MNYPDLNEVGLGSSCNMSTLVHMDNDLLAFVAGVGILILYLVFSAFTEMGTKLPWRK